MKHEDTTQGRKEKDAKRMSINDLKLFYNKSGLTRYSLACGYVDVKPSKDGGHKELYMEHQCYHVKKYDIDGKLCIWSVFDNAQLTQARKNFNTN